MKNLTPEVAEKYEMLAGHGVGEYRFKGRVVHLDKVDLSAADKFVADGFPYLVVKEVKAESKKLKAKPEVPTEDAEPAVTEILIIN